MLSTRRDYREITGDLGRRYEALLNTPEPFACGIAAHPETGLEGNSICYAAAIALITGQAGPEQFTDGAVGDAATLRLMNSVTAKTDPALAKDAT